MHSFSLLAAALAALPSAATAAQVVVTGPDITVVATSIDFGDKSMTAGPGVALTQKLRNNGTEDLVISDILIGGVDAGDFQFQEPFELEPIAPGGDMEFQILFAPRTKGTKTADLYVYSNDPETPVSVTPISGTGTNITPIAISDLAFGTEDQELTLGAPGLLVNDDDPDGSYLGLFALLVSPPTFGQLTLNDNGSFSYTPNQDFNGQDQFTYTVDDGFDISPTPAPVVLDIASVIDPPKLAMADTPKSGPTNSRTVQVKIVPAPMPDPPEFVDIADNSGFAAASSVPYSGQTEEDYTLSAGDGERDIFVRLRNEGGLSEVQSVSVLLDQTPPQEDPAWPFSVGGVLSTHPANVDLLFRVGFSEAVSTITSAGTAPGLAPDAIALGGVNSSGLSVTVSPYSARSTANVFDVQITGAVAEQGDLLVSLAPDAIVDQAGNVMNVSGIGASLSLATSVTDWRLME